MKVKAFLDVVRPYAALVGALGGSKLAAQMNALENAWTPAMMWNVKDLISRAWPSDTHPEADEMTVREFRDALGHLRNVLKTTAKQDIITDLSLLVDALEPHDRQDLAAFVAACQQALATVQAGKVRRSTPKKTTAVAIDEARVSALLAKLKETYKDADKFVPVYKAMSDDKSLTQADLAEIATRFAYETSASTKKAESLRRIWLVHESYASSAAKSKFSGGKSAA